MFAGTFEGWMFGGNYHSTNHLPDNQIPRDHPIVPAARAMFSIIYPRSSYAANLPPSPASLYRNQTPRCGTRALYRLSILHSVLWTVTYRNLLICGRKEKTKPKSDMICSRAKSIKYLIFYVQQCWMEETQLNRYLSYDLTELKLKVKKQCAFWQLNWKYLHIIQCNAGYCEWGIFRYSHEKK